MTESSYHFSTATCEGLSKRKNIFHPDALERPDARHQIGNLRGLGSLMERDPGFYREVYRTLHLNPRFRTISKAIQDAAWIYYTSAKGFIRIFSLPILNFYLNRKWEVFLFSRLCSKSTCSINFKQ